MVEYGFYHLTRTALEPALGRLLERVLASGQRAVVVVDAPVVSVDGSVGTIPNVTTIPSSATAIASRQAS